MRFACDTGGTFTDLIVEDSDGTLSMYKASTTPDDPILGVLQSLKAALAELRARDRSVGEREKLSQRLTDERERLVGERERIVASARQQAQRVRDEGQEKFWTVETSALGQALELLVRVDELPEQVQKAAEPLEDLVRQRLEVITSSPVDDYQSLNARNAISVVRELGWLDLAKVRRIEEEGKARKTVLAAIQAGLDRLQRTSHAA